MKANYKDKLEKPTSEISLGNLYDINKQLMDKEPVLSEDAINEAKEKMSSWFFNKIEQKYYMLLCIEQRDFTLFNLDGLRIGSPDKEKCILAAHDVVGCMCNRGVILAIDLREDGAYELWIRNDEGCFAYYLFPYGAAVLEY